MQAEHVKFLEWLINRLIYKHLYSQEDIVINHLRDIQADLSKDYQCEIDSGSLDSILSKYYVDFNLNKSEDFNVGFTTAEREHLRTTIRQIINDVVNKQINKEPIIKG